jgi:hypothetical protein
VIESLIANQTKSRSESFRPTFPILSLSEHGLGVALTRILPHVPFTESDGGVLMHWSRMRQALRGVEPQKTVIDLAHQRRTVRRTRFGEAFAKLLSDDREPSRLQIPCVDLESRLPPVSTFLRLVLFHEVHLLEP